MSTPTKKESFSASALYDLSKKKNDQEHTKYVNLWYDMILSSAKRGFFQTNLSVENDDVFYNNFCPYVLSALNTIKELFPGISVKQIGVESFDASFEVSWDVSNKNGANLYSNSCFGFVAA
jgi:hypothetical protein